VSASDLRTTGPYGRHYRTPHGIYPSVTTILDATKPAEDKAGIAWWAGEEPAALPDPGDEVSPLVARVARCSRQRAARRRAEDPERIRREATERGDRMHQSIERVLRGEEVWRPTPTWRADNRYEDSIRRCGILSRIGDVYAIEGPVWNTAGYAGTGDLFASVDGVPAYVDWKTARKQTHRSRIGDYCLQGIAYVAAWNEMVAAGDLCGVPLIRRSYIAVAYNGPPADVFEISDTDEMLSLARAWGARLAEFKSLVKEGKL
jgi:hypothetical protein